MQSFLIKHSDKYFYLGHFGTEQTRASHNYRTEAFGKNVLSFSCCDLLVLAEAEAGCC